MTRRTSTREAPLRAWGATLRRARQRRRRRRIGLAAGLPALLLAATIACPPTPRLVWNASPSVPIGLYRLVPGAPIARGDLVVARLSAPWRTLAARRHYLPAGVPLVKRVAAVAGDRVCATGATIWRDGVAIARRRAADPRGRPLPRWHGCVRLQSGQLFLLAPRADSFDGRYFGVTESDQIIGRARLLWRR